MPASQLKRLKASLREQGVTGPQKSKKQKKQHSSQKATSDRNHRNAALQQIRDSFNPFELKATKSRPEKFQSASSNGAGKYKEVLHRPGVTKSAGEEMRRNTLLPEMRRRNKVGGVIDRRIGEGDVDMTPEDRAVQRFAREKERKAKGRSMFDLEASDEEGPDDFGLTHGGRRLDDLEADDFGEMSGGDESEDDGGLLKRKRSRSDIDEEDDGVGAEEYDRNDQPERKKTKKEVMQEVIAKSKLHKYERQKAKEDDDDLRMELDQDFGEILSMLQNAKRPPPAPKTETAPTTDGAGPSINPDRQRLLDGMDRSKVDKEYDVRLKQLANDARAKPAERTKTAEEKAQEEAKRLQALEEKRQKRMRGEDVSDDEAPNDGAEPGADEDIMDQAAEFGLTNSKPNAKPKTEQLVLDDEDEFALDEELVASEDEIEDVELSEDEASDSDEDGEDAGGTHAPPENEEDEFVKDILGEDVAAASTGANNTTLGERGAASKLAYTYPCPRSHAELLEFVRDVPVEQLPTIVQRIRALYHPSLSTTNKESMADFSCSLVDHLGYMGDEKQSIAVSEQIIRHLHSLSRTYPTQIGEQFRRRLTLFHERGKANAGDLIILTAIGSIYPTSDHWHQVVTPATTLMARWLGLNAPSATKVVEDADLAAGAFFVGLCIKYQSLSKRYLPEAMRFTLRVLSCKDLEKSRLTPHLSNLRAMAELWKDKSAFTEIFTPALPILKSLPAKKEHQSLTILLQQARLRRRPLELHHHRKLPIRTSVPKFEENFNPEKHYDPDKERSDAKKLQNEFKREKKGALRELRKDANFIAREQLREKRERDAEHEKKERRLIAEINAEEGREANEYGREVAKRQRMKKK
ncbi:nucleolar complex 14 [Lecanosticta acicola]|uniref:Nucleolar complex 14 n=1 Tax=Lecanosticta acicola TaxID=111012 RepID=A0AAI9EE54_9PEZI|nr:nucleolar complex 14 [Lecanosticta acicola]